VRGAKKSKRKNLSTIRNLLGYFLIVKHSLRTREFPLSLE
jgi:hypothetical protein